MIPLTLPSSSGGESRKLSGLMGEGWERGKYRYYFETVNNLKIQEGEIITFASRYLTK